MKLTLLDRMIGWLAPGRGVQRLAERATWQQMQDLIGTASGGYAAAKPGRLIPYRPLLSENGVPAGQRRHLSADARDLVRNNPHAQKVLRQLEAKVIGRGMRLASSARDVDGRPHLAFRARAAQVWQQFVRESDWRGRPGKGGQTLHGQAKTLLRCVVGTGNGLFRTRPLGSGGRGRALPLALQLVDGDRLDGARSPYDDRTVIGGVELDAEGRPAAYWLLPHHPSDPRSGLGGSTRLPADQAGHLFAALDVDQVVGASWFAPVLKTQRNVEDYEYNELVAAAMAACVVLGVKRSRGAGALGLKDDRDPLLDEDGNRITKFAPGMVFDLGGDGKLEGFNPQRPNTSAADFIAHHLRSIAAGLPGLKGSSLTGDYRGSSFSSERSADNDVWPELEGVQDWFSCGFYQPVYEDVIDLAVLMGRFDDVLRPGEYVARRAELVAAEWQGPVARSINPTDDRTSAALGIRNLTSSPQIEAAKEGRSLTDNLIDVKEFVEQVLALDLPGDLEQQILTQVLGLGVLGGSPPASGSAGAAAAEDPPPAAAAKAARPFGGRLARLLQGVQS